MWRGGGPVYDASMSNRLPWGILGTGRIAEHFVQGLRRSQTAHLAAVASRTEAKARAFAGQYGFSRAYGSYQALLDDPTVKAVYIGTPHTEHLEWILRAAQAGKHVLCEKPLTMNAAEARRAVEACRAAGVLLMEAFMYRCQPQTDKIVKLVRAGALGQVKLVQVSFSINRPCNTAHRLWNKDLGGGAILDLGCYPVSLSRLIAGAACGQPFRDPSGVQALSRFGTETGADTLSVAHLEFDGCMLAQVSCGISLWQDRAARVYGDKAWLEVTSPFIHPFEGGKSRMTLWADNEVAEIIELDSPPLYAAEADAFAAAILAGASDVPAMTTGDTLGNMMTLDRWRAAVGQRYAQD